MTTLSIAPPINLAHAALRHFKPRPRMSTLAWAIQNAKTWDGQPYDHSLYPHLGAPNGPFDAFDDPTVRVIWLEFASRLGKTYFGQCCQMSRADRAPCPMMFATESEKLATEVIARTYKMLAHCRPLRKQLRKPRFRRQDRIDLDNCQIHLGWARAVSTLADKSVMVGHGNEIDKWFSKKDIATSTEGDPLQLFLERGKEFPGRKFILESTPSRKGSSRVEKGVHASDNRRFLVPCPHCGMYQRLRLGKPDEKGRLAWEHLPNGHSDPDLTQRTARYICEHCEGDILDHHRGPMMRAGVWVPMGCGVDHDKARQAADARRKDPDSRVQYLTGEPLRRGSDAGFQLSSLHALTLTFGDYAKQFVVSKNHPRDLQNFTNGWEGVSFEPYKVKATTETVGERLATDSPIGVVPEGGLFLTVASDRQREEGESYPFVVQAWGAEERSWLVDFGVCGSAEDLWTKVITRQYQHADGGSPMTSVIAFMDSGDSTKQVYDFCEMHRGVYPCKGIDSGGVNEPYRLSVVGGGHSSKRQASNREAQLQLVLVNTDFWETELQHRLEDRRPGEPGSLSLCAEAADDSEFLEQLLNGAMSDVVNKRGVTKLLWVKRDQEAPNDFRDAMRYGHCAARAWLDGRGGLLPERAAPGGHGSPRRQTAVIGGGSTRPDGRPWISR